MLLSCFFLICAFVPLVIKEVSHPRFPPHSSTLHPPPSSPPCQVIDHYLWPLNILLLTLFAHDALSGLKHLDEAFKGGSWLRWKAVSLRILLPRMLRYESFTVMFVQVKLEMGCQDVERNVLHVCVIVTDCALHTRSCLGYFCTLKKKGLSSCSFIRRFTYWVHTFTGFLLNISPGSFVNWHSFKKKIQKTRFCNLTKSYRLVQKTFPHHFREFESVGKHENLGVYFHRQCTCDLTPMLVYPDFRISTRLAAHLPIWQTSFHQAVCWGVVSSCLWACTGQSDNLATQSQSKLMSARTALKRRSLLQFWSVWSDHRQTDSEVVDRFH